MTLWIAALIAVGISTPLAIVAAATRRPALALPLPVVLLGVIALRVIGLAEPSGPWFTPLLTLGLVAMATAGGGPLVTFIFTVIVRNEKKRGRKAEHHEVLRGGAAIGYLERFGVAGAILVGQPAIIAVVVAVKGLGRFTELDTAAARERFIVGTLASLLWAATCATAITGSW